MVIDLLIVALAISALYRGREIGFTRQICATIGFFGGLFLGALLQSHTVALGDTEAARTAITIATTLGCAFAFLIIGEFVGLHIKQYLVSRHINKLDVGFGSVLNMISLLLSCWLVAAIISGLPLPELQTAVHNSRILSGINRLLPAAPTVLADLGKLIDPNGFPQVFIGQEPTPKSSVDLPSLGDLRTAVERDQASVVKVEGQGCGGVVDGSGFVAGKNLVATNAHVIAGIRQPYVQDGNGLHKATAIWFDPNLDFALLRVNNLAGSSLSLSPSLVHSGTTGAVLGYPGGGAFNAGPAAVLDRLTASGRNIYGRGHTTRDIYEVQATIIPGNSGGPLVAKDGSVIGMVFAESTSYDHVGYALTSPILANTIPQATARNQVVTTGSCAE